jgi:hypothetical protein
MSRDDALTFDSRSIGVHRPGLARLLSRLSAGVMVAPPVLLALWIVMEVLGIKFDAHASVYTKEALLTGWFVGAPLLAILSAIAGGVAPARPGKIAVDAEGIHAARGARAWTVPAREVTAGLVVPTTTGPAVDLHLADGRVLRVGVETDAQAHAVLDRLGVGPDRRRISVPLRGANRALVAGCITFPVSAFLGMIAAAFLATSFANVIPVLWLIFAWLAFVPAATLAARRLAAAPEIVIGADGVLIHRTSGDRLLRFSEIEGVSADGGWLVLDLRPPRGEIVGERIVLHGTDPSLASGLADRIREAMTLMRAEARAAAAAVLDPGEKPLAEWRAALAGVLGRAGDYRKAALGAEDLLAVLEDGSAPPARRIGAALALREGDHPEARERVRIAADACADEDTRAALEAAAEEEVDEEAIRRVVANRR